MKIGILVGLSLAAIGGAAYAHKRRGGTLSLGSIKESLDAARGAVQGRLTQAKDAVKRTVPVATTSKDRFGYTEYSVAKGDRELH